jgi:hypothetical protein
MRLILSTALLTLSVAAPVLSQTAAISYPPDFSQPIPLYTRGLGSYEWKISTKSPEAQRFYNQGVQLMYAFATDDAARSFREAWKRDSTCAMCYWGEAWAWGPYLNEAMATDDPPRAARAAELAVANRANASKREQALIDAMAVRYRPTQDSVLRKQLDTAYAKALGAAWKKNKKDLELGTMYGEALMLLEPRRGYWSLKKPSVGEIHSVLEAVLKRDITHPGACHLYIHATDRRTLITGSVAGATRCGPTSRRGIPTRRRSTRKGSRSIRRTTCTCCSTPRRTTGRAPSPIRAHGTTPTSPASQRTAAPHAADSTVRWC